MTVPRGDNGDTPLGLSSEMVVRRDGDLDLAFDGWVLGDGEQETNSGRKIHVVIYGTTSGKLITEVRRTFGTETAHSAAVHSSEWEALHWLKSDNDGQLGAASKRCWEEACGVWPPLAEYRVERVT